jgi:hypothetical protein
LVGYQTTSGNSFFIRDNNDGRDVFKIEDSPPSNAFIIKTSGNVGIATTAPAALLNIASTANQDLFRVDDNGDGDTSPFIIKADGNVGIGTTAPGQLLHVKRGTDGVVARFEDSDGTCDVNPTSTALVCSSDARLKKDVVILSSALDKVTALRGVSFRWVNQQDGTLRPGLIAQEVEQVIPEAVSTDGNGYKAIAYTNLIPYLIEATKELEARQQLGQLQLDSLATALTRPGPTLLPAPTASEAADTSLLDLQSQVAALSDRVSKLEASSSATAWTQSPTLPAILGLGTSSDASASAALISRPDLLQGLHPVDATISGTLKALGETFLGNTVIAGDLSVDGTMSVSGDSLSVVGTLYFQNGPLAELVDLFGGKVTIASDGTLTLSEGDLTVGKGKIVGNDSLRGRAQIKAGDRSVRVERDWQSEPSTVQLTPSYNTKAWIEDLSRTGFTIQVEQPPATDKDIHWLAIW